MRSPFPSLLACVVLTAALGRVAADEPVPVRIQVHKGHIDFMAGNDLVSRYHLEPTVAKPYFWPLNAAGGVPVTRSWPMEKAGPGVTTDHPHQKSVWFCHGDVIPEGVELKNKIKGVDGVDFWSEAPGHGLIVTTEVGEPRQGKNYGSVATRNEWRTADGMKIMDESRTLHLYTFGPTRLLVFDIDLAAAVPVTFGDTKEGSMGVRVNDTFTEKNGGKLENAEGKVGEKACWGQRSDWCDYSGTVDGKTVGLAILDDPANPYRACWHSRGYGLMAANPFGRTVSGFPAMKGKTDLAKLAKGEHLKLRYGVLVHPGDAKEGKVAERYQTFVKN